MQHALFGPRGQLTLGWEFKEKSQKHFCLYCLLNMNAFACEVSPGDVVLSGHGPGQRGVSGRGQWGGAYRLAAAHVGANMVVLMRGVRWKNTHILFFSFYHAVTHRASFHWTCTFIYLQHSSSHETSSSHDWLLRNIVVNFHLEIYCLIILDLSQWVKTVADVHVYN